MKIEELQKQIENLPEQDKQAIKKLMESNDENMEKAIGGLSNKAKAALISLGVLAVGSILGAKELRKRKNDEVELTELGPKEFLKHKGLTQTQINWLEQND